jgi:hypothetical protein
MLAACHGSMLRGGCIHFEYCEYFVWRIDALCWGVALFHDSCSAKILGGMGR